MKIYTTEYSVRDGGSLRQHAGRGDRADQRQPHGQRNRNLHAKRRRAASSERNRCRQVGINVPNPGCPLPFCSFTGSRARSSGSRAGTAKQRCSSTHRPRPSHSSWFDDAMSRAASHTISLNEDRGYRGRRHRRRLRIGTGRGGADRGTRDAPYPRRTGGGRSGRRGEIDATFVKCDGPESEVNEAMAHCLTAPWGASTSWWTAQGIIGAGSSSGARADGRLFFEEGWSGSI